MLAWMCALAVGLSPAASPCAEDCPYGHGWIWPGGLGPGSRPVRYHPQPGDILLFSTREPGYFVTFGIARSGHPYHSAIVIRLRDGHLALLESGGGGVKAVNIRLLAERLPFHFTEYAERRPIAWARRLRAPLPPDKVEALTAFAEKYYGKPFSPRWRLAQLALPRPLIPRTSPDQASWFCSEIVAQALLETGLLPPGSLEPATIKPRNLYFDKGIDLSHRWEPPARWSCTCKPPPPGPHLGPK